MSMKARRCLEKSSEHAGDASYLSASPASLPAASEKYRFLPTLHVLFYLCLCLFMARVCEDVIPLTMRPVPFVRLADGGVVRDPSLNYPVLPNEELYNLKVLGMRLGIISPIWFIIITGSSVFREKGGKSWKVHTALSSYLVGMGCTEFLTDFLKLTVGRLRPNFYALCSWSDVVQSCAAGEMERAARKSFPSGHASNTFCAMTVIALFLGVEVTRLTRTIHASNGHASNVTSPPLALLHIAAALSPILAASYMSAGRIATCWHHDSDVLAGAVIGLSCGKFAWGLFHKDR